MVLQLSVLEATWFSYGFIEVMAMENMDREIVCELLKSLMHRELISKTTCSAALDLVYSMIEFPQLLQYPVSVRKEADHHEHSESPQ